MILLKITAEEVTTWSKVATTFYGLLPFLISLFNLKKGKTAYTIFSLYLLLSCASDLSGFLIFKLNFIVSGYFLNVKYAVYSLFDGLLPMLFMLLINKNKRTFNKLIFSVFIIIILLWMFEYLFKNPLMQKSLMFDLIYALTTSFIAGYSLLLMAEETIELPQQPDFWLFTGIFFYFFCGGFTYSLIETKVGLEYWFFHNIFMITGYTLYTIGLIKLLKKNSKKKILI